MERGGGMKHLLSLFKELSALIAAGRTRVAFLRRVSPHPTESVSRRPYAREHMSSVSCA